MVKLIETYSEALYNVGALLSYGLICVFAIHLVEMIIKGGSPHWTLVTMLCIRVSQLTLQLPYEWPKRSMRVNSLISLSIYLVLLCAYLVLLVR